MSSSSSAGAMQRGKRAPNRPETGENLRPAEARIGGARAARSLNSIAQSAWASHWTGSGLEAGFV